MNRNVQTKAEDDEEDLYAMIYGEDAPKAAAKPVPPVPVKQENLEFQDIYGESAAEEQLRSYQQQPFQYQPQPQPQPQQQQQQSQQQPAIPPGAFQPKAEEEEDEDFDIQLDAPQPAAQMRPEADDDDLDIQLDEPVAGLPPSIAQRSSSQQFPPARQSSTGAPSAQPGTPAIPGPRPPPGAPGVGLTPRPGVAPPRPPPGPPPPGHPAAASSVVAPPPMPSQWPRPQFVHTGAGASNLPRDEGNAVLPSQAGDHQLIRLPGQTRVSPEEYKEFLGLGHGDVFDLDPDRVVQAPWRMPGADPADFFNYGLNINTWKEYVARIHQFRLEFTMQKKIQTYESSHDTPALDPDLPPELAAAVAQGRQQGMMNGAAGPASTSQPSRPFPPHRQQGPPQKSPNTADVDSALVLAGRSDNAIPLTGGPSQDTTNKESAKKQADANGNDRAADEALAAAEGLVAQAKASPASANGQTMSAGSDKKPEVKQQPKPPPGKPPGTGPSPPNPGMGNGPVPPMSRAAANGPGFIRPPTGMRPIEGPPMNMNGNLAMSMAMSGPMGGPPFRPHFPQMGPYPMMPMGPYPMMHGMPASMMMGPGQMPGGPMRPPPMGNFMPDFGREGFRDFGDRAFMDGPHMFGGQGRAPNEDDDHGGGAFRGDDGVGGDTLAMGMDVDIPAATTAGDRREAERRRGREGRYEQDDYRRSSHRDYDRSRSDHDYHRHHSRDWDGSEDQDGDRARSRDRDRDRERDGHRSWHDSDDYDRHSRYR